MLYRCYFVQRGVESTEEDFKSNSFDQTKRKFLEMAKNTKFIGTEAVLIMRCGGMVSNRFDFSDPVMPIEVKPFV